ncbi:hypothetical protein HPB47_014583 [Ixodes persulcatus]|uniref:Uncharacterized protein n=1 Tax=Ixodes persulcatus TaxID=34615 RepID=A0AC60QVP0_IXOPE|nr:hypothetical protein HPB47_014583 [Ixodes persulcatus]
MARDEDRSRMHDENIRRYLEDLAKQKKEEVDADNAAKAAGWQTARSRKYNRKLKKEFTTAAKKDSRTHTIILRVRELNVNGLSRGHLLGEIAKAAGVQVAEAFAEDSLYINSASNTISIRTDNSERAGRYVEIKEIISNNKKIEVHGHGATPGEFQRIVLTNVYYPTDVVDEAERLKHMVNCNKHTVIVDVKRMGRSILITLGTSKLPAYIKFFGGVFPFHIYRETKRACMKCWRLGQKNGRMPREGQRKVPQLWGISRTPAKSQRCQEPKGETAPKPKEGYAQALRKRETDKKETELDKLRKEMERKFDAMRIEYQTLKREKLAAEREIPELRQKLQEATTPQRQEAGPSEMQTQSVTRDPRKKAAPVTQMETEDAQSEVRVAKKRRSRADSESTDVSELNDIHHGRGTPSRLDLEVVLETKVDRRGREVLAQSEDDSVLSGWYNFIYWLLDFLLSEQYDADLERSKSAPFGARIFRRQIWLKLVIFRS